MYTLDILYFSLDLFLILASIIPFIFDLISKRNKEENNSNDKPNAPLLPIDENKV